MHPRPPGAPLSKSEEVALDAQVLRRPGASTHELRTGDTAPGSIPLAEISPVLANPRTARYEKSKSQARLGLLPAASKGAFGVLHSLGSLNEKLKEEFIINSSFTGPTFFVMQTVFMKQIITDSMEDWILLAASRPDAGRHGLVTDADQSFFRNGHLIVTCAFSTVLCQTSSHFHHLNRCIVIAAGPNFQDKFLLAIMDYSGAQRSAHESEFVETKITLKGGSWHMLSTEAQSAERKYLHSEVSKYEQGCETHFWRSGTRLTTWGSGALIPGDMEGIFNDHLHRMISSQTTADEFEETIQSLQTLFPQINGWIEWWMCPKIASMIFPAKSTIDPQLAEEVPHTSNPVETQHSLLHHATGTDNDLMAGIEKLFLHMVELERQYKAVQGAIFYK
ncbi:hypothetical protein BKA93DRAFT_823858 [Sparassis latifolia]